MKTVAFAGTMQVDLEVVAKIATEKLGMRPATVELAPHLDPYEQLQAMIPHIDTAISEVVNAIDKLDRDQHTRAEAAALRGLVRSAKQLRLAVRQSKALSPQKGKTNV